MIVGIITGTYSTIYIANPVFLWLEERSMRKRRSGDGKSLQAPSRRDKEELAKA
jgi:preprotein translocase subunit SecF